MKARVVEHRAGKLKPGGVIRSIPTRWSSTCSCGWSGPLCVTKARADATWQLHVRRQQAELRDAIEIDRAAGLDGDDL